MRSVITAFLILYFSIYAFASSTTSSATSTGTSAATIKSTATATSNTTPTSSPASEFKITNLKIQKVRGANTTLQFTVYDPDPLTNETRVCKDAWKTGSAGYPDGPYVICGKSTFAWTMATYTSMSDFQLDIEHSYKDPAVGQPPYNIITTFAEANISRPAITCSKSTGGRTCRQVPGTTINAPIYAAVAKR